MRIPLLVLLTAVCFPLSAQFKNWSLRAAMNYPQISDVSKTLEPKTAASAGNGVGELHEIYSDKKPGFDLASTATFRVRKMIVETGLGINYYRFKRHIEVRSNVSLDFWDLDGVTVIPGQQIVAIGGTPSSVESQSNDYGRTSTLYVQIPVSVGRFFFKERLLLKVGLASSFLIRSAENTSTLSYSAATNSLQVNESTKKNGEEFSDVLLSTTFQITYFITKRIGVDLTWQRSLNSFYDSQIGDSHYNIFSLGTSYHFFKKSGN